MECMKRTKRRQYKSGSVREKNGRHYIRWYDFDGERHEEAAGTDRRAAERLLQQRVGEAAAGKKIAKASGDVTVRDCLNLVLADMKQRGLASHRIAQWKVKSVIGDAVGWMRAAAFDWKECWKYVEHRRSAGVRDSTINREISLLRAAFKLAADPNNAMLHSTPQLPSLDEGDNVRTGFLTPSEYAELIRELPDELKALTCVAYNTGLRRGTLLSLKLSQVDLEEGLIWVSRRQTKNRMSQTSPILPGEMRSYIDMALSANKEYLFERDGKRIRCFRAAWTKATAAAGLPDLKFHDLRRTAVRDWISSGASTETAMAISGHKTASMLQRYNIMDAATIKRAAAARAVFDQIPKSGEIKGKDASIKPS